MHGSLNAGDLLAAEIDQRRESGYLIAEVEAEIDRLGGLPALDAETATRLFTALEDAPRDPDWSYEEPDALEQIKAAAQWDALRQAQGGAGGAQGGAGGAQGSFPIDERYADQVLRAWTGRIAGNMLGKPVENGDLWTPAAITSFLQANDAWPLVDYFPDVADTGDDHPDYLPNRVQTTRGRVNGSSRDDDVDYTILNLHILRHAGPGFGPEDVAAGWLTLLPFLQTYTAERAAIRNLINGVAPDRAATVRNPYREWIGAAIRADVFGYVCPGDPARAAELAFNDAALSHRGNGIYGEMWCAALVAAAFTAGSAAEALDTSMKVVPRRSRLHQALDDTRNWHRSGLSWEQTRTEIESAFGHYGWVHTINNAAVLAAGLLYGDGDFSQSIGLTVCGGWDTDSNGGTAGSVAGLLAQRIPPHWSEPLADTVRSAVFGYDGSSISELARHTVEVAVALDSMTPVQPSRAIPRGSW